MKKKIKKYIYNKCAYAQAGKDRNNKFFIIEYDTPKSLEASVLSNLIKKHFKIKRSELYDFMEVLYY